MNEILEKFLGIFDLGKMGHQPFILVEYYPSQSTPGITQYITLGKFYGPTQVTFQGDNVSFLSCYTPVQVKLQKGMSFHDERIEVTNECKTASFHMADYMHYPISDLGNQTNRTWRRCRLFWGKEEVEHLIKCLYCPEFRGDGENKEQWDRLKRMYEQALPKLGFLQHDFTLQNSVSAGL